MSISQEEKVTIVVMDRNVEANNMTPITISSNTGECFAARKGSFTSCPTDRIIDCMIRLSKSTRGMLNIENDGINAYCGHSRKQTRRRMSMLMLLNIQFLC